MIFMFRDFFSSCFRVVFPIFFSCEMFFLFASLFLRDVFHYVFCFFFFVFFCVFLVVFIFHLFLNYSYPRNCGLE